MGRAERWTRSTGSLPGSSAIADPIRSTPSLKASSRAPQTSIGRPKTTYHPASPSASSIASAKAVPPIERIGKKATVMRTTNIRRMRRLWTTTTTTN
jgi:hypothetical protein